MSTPSASRALGTTEMGKPKPAPDLLHGPALEVDQRLRCFIDPLRPLLPLALLRRVCQPRLAAELRLLDVAFAPARRVVEPLFVRCIACDLLCFTRLASGGPSHHAGSNDVSRGDRS